MGRFVIRQFTGMLEQLAKAPGSRTSPSNEDVMAQLLFFQGQCKEIEFQKGIWDIERVKQKIVRGEMQISEVRSELTRLLQDIQWELGLRMFYYCPTDRKAIFDEIQEGWKSITTVFPETFDEVNEVKWCYALERNTACVFHVMRIAEYGLRHTARTLKIRLTDKGKSTPIEHAVWQKIIESCNGKIEKAKKLPGGTRKAAALEFYSSIADHCLYMKDIWRNNIAHVRRPYTAPEALAAIRTVHGFMNLLAQKRR